jgi:hypothetical protein
MNNSIESELELGRLAQKVLDRITTDPDFRNSLGAITNPAGSLDESGSSHGDDVSGYSMPHTTIIDPVFPDGVIDFARVLPVVKWLSFFYEIGLIGNPYEAPGSSGDVQTTEQQPRISLPASGGPITF